jgi:hypothetical protein
MDQVRETICHWCVNGGNMFQPIGCEPHPQKKALSPSELHPIQTRVKTKLEGKYSSQRVPSSFTCSRVQMSQNNVEIFSYCQQPKMWKKSITVFMISEFLGFVNLVISQKIVLFRKLLLWPSCQASALFVLWYWDSLILYVSKFWILLIVLSCIYNTTFWSLNYVSASVYWAQSSRFDLKTDKIQSPKGCVLNRRQDDG